jgi:hypothetical protein
VGKGCSGPLSAEQPLTRLSDFPFDKPLLVPMAGDSLVPLVVVPLMM